MAALFWDASALIKHYIGEEGSETVSTLLALVPEDRQFSTLVTYSECYSILIRRRNSGAISDETFGLAATVLELNFIGPACFNVIDVESTDYLASTVQMSNHNLNSSDAVLLSTLIRTVEPTDRVSTIIVSTDLRLLRAGLLEGFTTIDPMSINGAEAQSVWADLILSEVHIDGEP